MNRMILKKGKYILTDAANQPRSLVNLRKPAINQSDLAQKELIEEVNGEVQKLFDQTPSGAVNAIIYLRLVNGLMRKAQIFNALHVGRWSPLDDALANTLPKFNAKNFLWSYVPVRPVGKFANVNFIFAEVQWGGYRSRK